LQTPSEKWNREDHILRIKEYLLNKANAQGAVVTRFASRLRRFREQAGMAKSELAAACAVSLKTVCRWENGLAFPRPSAAQRLAQALGVSVPELRIPKSAWKRLALPHHAFKGVISDDNGHAIAYNVRKASLVSGYTVDTLYRYAKQLPEEYRFIFPEGRLPSKRRRVPGTKKCRQRTITPGDLEILTDEINKVLHGSDWASHLRTSEEICDKHHIDDTGDRILVGVFLRMLGDDGTLTAPQIHRPKPTSRKGWYSARVYDPDEVSRYLRSAGRDLADVAREFGSKMATANGQAGSAALAEQTIPPPPPHEGEPRRGPSLSTDDIAAGGERDRSPEGERISAVAATYGEKALLILRREPNRTLRSIARELECSVSTLSEDPAVRRMRQAHVAAPPPRGEKSDEGELEAFED
jgi:transcriptional regulator with XRE-family HTH domain